MLVYKEQSSRDGCFFCSRAIFGRVFGVLTLGGASYHRHAENPLNGVFCKNN